MDDNEVRGRPVRALSDMEFDQQGTRRTSRATGLSAGRAEQFVHHSTRMPKLEPEYMRRHSRLGLAMNHRNSGWTCLKWSDGWPS
jgi:hypothetical protein